MERSVHIPIAVRPHYAIPVFEANYFYRKKQTMERMDYFLKDQSSFTRQLVDGVSDMIYVLDQENNTIQFLNSRVYDVLYHDENEDNTADGAFLFNRALHPGDAKRRKEHLTVCARLRDGEAVEMDVRLKVKDGSYRWFRIRDLVFARKENGTVRLLTGIIRPAPVATMPAEEDGMAESWPAKDLTRLLLMKDHELQFLHSELQAFTGVVVHDYLETLRQVYLSLELIISSEAQSFKNPSRAHLRRAQSMLQRLNLLTRDIAAYAEIQAPAEPAQTVDLYEIIEGVLNELRPKTIAANAVIDCQALPRIEGYPLLLRVMFHQIITNTLRFRLPSRTLIIRIYAERLEARDMTHPESYPGKSYHKVVIQDNGTGFDPSDSEKIFEMFYQGHNKLLYKGSGMGLTIARKIMHIHGGFIAARSVTGKGAEISCYFVTSFV
jgi:signal transduction histidine kinase